MNKLNTWGILLFLLTALPAFSQDTLYFDSQGQKSSKNAASFSRVIKDSMDLFLVKDYYLSGKVQMVALSTTKDSLNKTGIEKTFHENGQVHTIGEYKGNLLEGNYFSFHENGHKSSEGRYHQGKMTGNWVFYHENGKVQSRFGIKDGLADGPATTYYEDGAIQRKVNYVDGQFAGKWISYRPSGDIERMLDYELEWAVPMVKEKLRFTPNRWCQIDQATDGNFLRAIYMGTALKDLTNKNAIPPRIHIFVSNDADSVQEKYTAVMERLNIQEFAAYSFPDKLPATYSDARTFYKQMPKGQVSKWTSVCFQSSSKKLLILLFEVEDGFWEEQVKVFNEILLNFR